MWTTAVVNKAHAMLCVCGRYSSSPSSALYASSDRSHSSVSSSVSLSSGL